MSTKPNPMPTWQAKHLPDGRVAHIEKVFAFADFDAAMRFANKVAAIAQVKHHHPMLLVQWGSCVVRWSTHDAGQVTRLDVDCAALTDAVLQALPA